MLKSIYSRGSLKVRQMGLSIVELMVGITIGLIVVAGATALFLTNLGNSRRLLVEARLNQDLRGAADVIARELRRAGYWENSIAGTVAPPAASVAASNPNAPMVADAASAAISYSVARDTANGRCTSTSPCTNNTSEGDEQFGFQLDSGVLKMKVGSGSTPQPLTDPTVMTINAFAITPNGAASMPLSSACVTACSGGGCPTLSVRSYTLTLSGTAVSDSNVTRVLRETVRVRNDLTEGSCP